tara:strand:- start:136 stop:321 length:186 start_codon:yes stop_codon:yes gene_type:complete
MEDDINEISKNNDFEPLILEGMSIEALESYKIVLEREIKRVLDEIGRKAEHREKAQNLFNS